MPAAHFDSCDRGTGLDFYEDEASIPAGLTDLENVVLLPHLEPRSPDRIV
ncbi:hypothetical protein QN219_14750 [Sinorhizobium sp. 7-81]|nr:hypothetical protein [Sinorhizobium sp. 8-89]MDK1491305.1 hypothetical protein [Sinorhizobium sp. 8-89]